MVLPLSSSFRLTMSGQRGCRCFFHVCPLAASFLFSLSFLKLLLRTPFWTMTRKKVLFEQQQSRVLWRGISVSVGITGRKKQKQLQLPLSPPKHTKKLPAQMGVKWKLHLKKKCGEHSLSLSLFCPTFAFLKVTVTGQQQHQHQHQQQLSPVSATSSSSPASARAQAL